MAAHSFHARDSVVSLYHCLISYAVDKVFLFILFFRYFSFFQFWIWAQEVGIDGPSSENMGVVRFPPALIGYFRKLGPVVSKCVNTLVSTSVKSHAAHYENRLPILWMGQTNENLTICIAFCVRFIKPPRKINREICVRCRLEGSGHFSASTMRRNSSTNNIF